MYGVFSYIYHKNQPNVGKYTIYMDPMGVSFRVLRVHPTSTFVKFQSLISFLHSSLACHVVLLLLVEDPEFESEGWESFDDVSKMGNCLYKYSEESTCE